MIKILPFRVKALISKFEYSFLFALPFPSILRYHLYDNRVEYLKFLCNF